MANYLGHFLSPKTTESAIQTFYLHFSVMIILIMILVGIFYKANMSKSGICGFTFTVKEIQQIRGQKYHLKEVIGPVD